MREHLITEGNDVLSRVTVGRNLDDHIIEAAVHSGARRVAVLCQPNTRNLAEYYANGMAMAGLEAGGYTLPDSEEAKQMGVVEEVYRYLNVQRFTRSDLIVGVGGGALTDVAGFIGGTYLRGIRVGYVATTLVAAVDAAIGGKTGVNVDGKNLAGVFKHPDTVMVDIDILDELPIAQKVEGAAEAVKTGFIEDAGIVDAYEAHGLDADLEDIVNRSIAVKARVVSEDFRENGLRAILNYGHTVGHAIETSTGRSHGHSVGIGMVAAGAASAHALGFPGSQRQNDLIAALGLPTSAPDAKKPNLRALMALDKKRDATGLRMVLLEEFGRPVVQAVDDATVEAALDAVGVD